MIAATSNWLAAHAKNPRQLVYLLEIDTYGKVFGTFLDGVSGVAGSYKAWISDISGGDQTVDPLNGSSQLNDITISVIDKNAAVTGDFPSFLFEGKSATLKQGYPGLAESDFITIFTGTVDTVETDKSSTVYNFNLRDNNRLNQQVVYLNGDDGSPTDSDNPKTVVGNPMDILDSVLQLYVGFADHEVDLDTIHAFRDSLWAGMEFSFSITSPPEAKNFIEQELLKPLGGFGFTDNLGRYSVQFMQPEPGAITAEYSFTADDVTEPPAWQQNDLVNTINYRFDNDGSKFMAETVQLDGDSIDRFGQQGQSVIESQGVRSGFQGFALAAMVCRSIFARYGNKNPKLTLAATWDSILVAVGDYVAVTNPLIPNRGTGAMGITNVLFQVMAKTPDFIKGTISFDVTDASGIQSFGLARIAPNATPDFTGASTFEKGRYLFVTDTNGKQSDDSTGATFA